MVITKDDPGAHRVLVMKNGEPVGLVLEVDTETRTLKRLDLEAWRRGEKVLIEDTYDQLIIDSPRSP